MAVCTVHVLIAVWDINVGSKCSWFQADQIDGSKTLARFSTSNGGSVSKNKIFKAPSIAANLGIGYTCRKTGTHIAVQSNNYV